MTSAMNCLVLVEDVFGSYSKIVSRKVIAPQFSIAPAAKSGIASMSSLGNGYFIPKYFSYSPRNFFVNSKDNFALFLLPFVVSTRIWIFLNLVSTYSNSPTPRYRR